MKSRSSAQRLGKFFFGDSWIDLFIQWLHNLPLPYWLTCIIVGLLSGISIVLIEDFKFQDRLTLLEFSSFVLTFPYGLYVLWGLKNDQRSLNNSFGILAQKILTKETPRLLSMFFILITGLLRILFVLVVSVLLVLISLSFIEKSSSLLEDLGYLFFGIVLVFSFSTIILLASRIFRILSAIYQLKSKNIDLNLFDLSPLYKLSQITQKVALYLLPLVVALELSVIPSYIYNGTFDASSFMSATGIEIFIFFLGPLLILLSGLVFVMPVFWIRKRIIETKSNALSELGKKLQMAFNDQDQYAEQGNFSKVVELKGYVDALIARKEYFQRISDWPWETRIFREFSAAILIPIVLSISQLYLSRWFGR